MGEAHCDGNPYAREVPTLLATPNAGVRVSWSPPESESAWSSRSNCPISAREAMPTFAKMLRKWW